MKDWPDTYYACIFTSQRSDAGEDLYPLISKKMVDLATSQKGFLGVESVRDEEGLGITVSYWRSRDDIAAWGEHAEHRVAMDLGRTEFYDWFQLRIAEVSTTRNFGIEEA